MIILGLISPAVISICFIIVSLGNSGCVKQKRALSCRKSVLDNLPIRFIERQVGMMWKCHIHRLTNATARKWSGHRTMKHTRQSEYSFK